MLFILSLILSRSNCILILVISNLACSAPLKSRKRAANGGEQGFSSSPKILEIQLPLKIASKEDLLAWSKYVMTLVASKINSTSTGLKNIPAITAQQDKRLPFTNNPGLKSKEVTKKVSVNEKRQNINYPIRRLKEPPRSPDDMVIAYPLPVGKMKFTEAKLQEQFNLPAANVNGPTADQQLYFEQYSNFNIDSPFHHNEPAVVVSPEMLAQSPPVPTYLPLPLRTTDIVSYQDAVDRSNEVAQMSRNRSQINEPLLTFPFQAVITINRQLPLASTTSKIQQKDHAAVHGDPSDEFPPYFEKNYTITNESGQVNVILDDFIAGTNKKKIKKNEEEEEYDEDKEEEEEVEEEEEEEKENQQSARTQKKKNEKNRKDSVKKEKSNKRQPFVLGDLLRTLGILRKVPKNSTEINVATPVLSILKPPAKGVSQQKIQVSFEDTVPNRDRRNETFAQQTDENQSENDTDGDDDDEEEGGSLQGILDLLPLAAPLLEELSDPDSDVDLAEVLQGAIPLIEGLSDPNEEGGIDIPGVLVPLSQKLSEGQDGQGSDSGAILGPIIQLIAPLIGPLSGPLIGPLSRTSSSPGGKDGSGQLITSLSAPLSKPEDYYGQSILSKLIAGITASLSKESAKSADESDIKSLVSAVVSGVLAGASTGSSYASKGPKNQYGNTYGQRPPYGYGNKDTYSAQTTYGQPYGSYGSYKPQSPNIGETISSAVKQILGAFLKLSATSSTSSANLSGTSSSSSANLSASSSESKEKQPVYGVPMHPPYYGSHYSAPPPPPTKPAYAPPGTTSSSYTTFKRQSQNKLKTKK